MKELQTSTNRIEYRHYVEYENVKYIREETLSLKHYSWESEPDKLLDFHTISWRSYDEDEYQENGNIEYFTISMGWAKDGRLAKSNPVPIIEQKFKETIGKNLIYFKN